VTKDDVTIVPVPQAQLQQVLDQGGVDAIIAYAPTNIKLTRKAIARSSQSPMSRDALSRAAAPWPQKN
jgi:ABC-type nitrate/sulfonate/bicarbonate transport system substrate-binding protein